MFKDLLHKKGISSVVLVSILIAGSVMSFFVLSQWYTDIQSKLELQAMSNNIHTHLEIEKISETSIYILSRFKLNLALNYIKIGDRMCVNNLIISPGVNKINIKGCIVGLQNMTPYDVQIGTNLGLYSAYKILRDIPEKELIIRYTKSECNSEDGYTRLYGVDSIDNSHVEIDGSGIYNVCAKHVNYTIGNQCTNSFANLFLIASQNNSHVYTETSQVHSASPDYYDWYNICLNSFESTVHYLLNETADERYTCIASINKNDIYGASIASCDYYKDNLFVFVG